MKRENYRSLENEELLKLASDMQDAFNIYSGNMRKLSGYKDSPMYEELREEIRNMTGVYLSTSTLRDIVSLKHKGMFRKDTLDAIDKFITSYTNSPSILAGKGKAFDPVKQSIFWAVNQGYKAGAFVNSFKGAFIEWDKLKEEIEKSVITQCPRIIPTNSRVELADFYGKKNWIIKIVDKKGQEIGDVWIGGDPYKDWHLDGLVRIGKTYSDSKWDVWQILQRYSDSSYRILKSFV